ncbi:MAG: TlpA disulfide reductase family protein [Puia sp.]|nr:TlpA disulfide reductase family protein [Puia sp.]
MQKKRTRFKYLIKALFLFLLPTMLNAQPPAYQITGHLPGLEEGEKVIMSLILDGSSKVERRDSGYVIDGAFHLTGNVPEGPRLYFMDFDRHPTKTCRLLINNNEKITVRCDSNILRIDHGYLDDYLQIEGSPSNHTWHFFYTGITLYCQSTAQFNGILRKIRDSIGFDAQEVGSAIMAKKELNKALYYGLLRNPEPADVYIPAMLMELLGDKIYERSGHDAFLMAVYNASDDAAKRTYYGKLFHQYAILSVGQPFPEFVLPDLDDKPLALRDVVSKSKLTIVHFWAVNSYIRKETQDELRSVYKRYHDKGLNIIGVSSDTADYEWKGFLKTQQFPWFNVSDLKGGEGVVGKIYHEYGKASEPATTNVLIDSADKIIAWDPSPTELLWYLWKYFDSGNNIVAAKDKQ